MEQLSAARRRCAKAEIGRSGLSADRKRRSGGPREECEGQIMLDVRDIVEDWQEGKT